MRSPRCWKKNFSNMRLSFMLRIVQVNRRMKKCMPVPRQDVWLWLIPRCRNSSYNRVISTIRKQFACYSVQSMSRRIINGK